MSNYNNFDTDKPYKVGYALSGGFIKGFAHLGVMQALLEHDIKPDIISGVVQELWQGCFMLMGMSHIKLLSFSPIINSWI